MYARFKTSPEYKVLKREEILFRRRILFLALLSDKLKESGVDAALVGGQAIDFCRHACYIRYRLACQ
jgi:nicotinamidase-related amidase